MIAKPEVQNNHPCSGNCDCSNLQPLFRGGETTHFTGKSNTYHVETYRSGKGRFTELSQYSGVKDVVTGLYLPVHHTRDRKISIERMEKSLSYPRTILELIKYQDGLVGFGIFTRLLISSPEKFTSEPVIHSTRAILSEHEGQGLGTHILERAVQLHQEESHKPLRWGALMTQNPLSVFTLEKVPSVDEIYPFAKRYNANRWAQFIMLGVHQAVLMNSLGINTVTGVSKGELSGLGMNETWRPRPDQGRVWEIYQEMISPTPYGLDMNREAGDVVYVIFGLKKPKSVIVEVPSTKAA